MVLISSDYIYTPTKLLQRHCLEISPEGEIIDIRPLNNDDRPKMYPGILCPGFVNAHCHLELSVLEGRISPSTGMTGFIRQVMGKRNDFSSEEQTQAAQVALDFLWKTGTVAVGDICNTDASIISKRQSPVFTYSFIELLGLGESRVAEILQNGLNLKEKFAGLPHSLSPHAPYSMSETLIRAVFKQRPERVSIHLLESAEERQLFEENSGPFVDFYRQMGIPFSGFPTKNPIQYVLSGAEKNQPMILVHNTRMTDAELKFIRKEYSNTWFCLCPGSNLYIHNTFPDLALFAPYSDRICLGTDSLASNHSIDVFEEVKLVQERQPEIPLHEVLRWAITNGASALGASSFLGAFTPGTTPGINLISEIDLTKVRLRRGAKVKKLA